VISEEEAKKIEEMQKKELKKEEVKAVPVDEKKESTTEVKEEKEDDDKTPPPLGNGGKTDKYVWVQTLSDLTMTIPVPLTTKSKMLDVNIGTKKIKVGIKGQPPIINGEFPEKIKVKIN